MKNNTLSFLLNYSKKGEIQTPSFPFIYQIFQDLFFQNNHLVDCVNGISIPKDNLLEDIIDKSLEHIVGQNIYYHSKMFKLYQKVIPNNDEKLDINQILTDKQKFIYLLNEK